MGSKNEITLNQNTKLAAKIEAAFGILSSHTSTAYKCAISQFLDFTNTGINTIQEIKPNHIKEYIEYLKEVYKPSSVNIKINALKKFFNVLEAVNPDIRNPFNTLKTLKVKTSFNTEKGIKREFVLSNTETKELCSHYELRGKMRMAVLVKTLRNHGLRISEAINIKIKDIKKINPKLWTVSVKGKGCKIRMIQINAEQYYEMISVAGKKYVFETNRGNPMDRVNATKDISKTAFILFGKKISAHSLRHTFATKAIEKMPGKVKAISSYLGHADVSTTLKMYVHQSLSLDDLSDMAV